MRIVLLCLLLLSCVSKEPLMVKPNWYEKSYSHPNKVYGVGIGRKTNDAVNKALINLLSDLSVVVNSKTNSSVSSTKKDGRFQISKKNISRTVIEVKRTFTSEYTLEKIERVGGSRAVLISLKKDDLINVLNLNIKNIENNIKYFKLSDIKNRGVLERIKLLNESSGKINSINYLISIMNYLDKNVTISYKRNPFEGLIKKEMDKVTVKFKQKHNVKFKYFLDVFNKTKSVFKGEIQDSVKFDTANPVAVFSPFPIRKFNANMYANRVALSDDDRYILFSRFNRIVYLNLEKNEVVHEMEWGGDSSRGRTNSIDISSNGDFAVTGDSDGYIRIWSLKEGKLISYLKGHKGAVNSVKISNDNKFIISGGRDTSVRYWDVQKGSVVFLSGHRQSVSYVNMSNDGKLAISASMSSKEIRQWDLASGKEIKIYKNQYSSNKSIAMSKNGKYLLTLSDNKKFINYIDLMKKSTIKKIPFHNMKNLRYLAFSKNDKFAIFHAYTKYGSGVAAYDLDNFKEVIYNIAKFKNIKAFLVSKNSLLSFHNDGESLSWEEWSINDMDTQIYLNNLSHKRKSSNDVFFNFNNCSDVYRAINQRSGKGVDIRKECLLISVNDYKNNELFSTRLTGKISREFKQKTLNTVLRGRDDSYYSHDMNSMFNQMILDLNKHKYLKYIMKEGV